MPKTPRIPARALPAETERLAGVVPPRAAEPGLLPSCLLGAAQTIGAREQQEDHFAVFEPADPAFRAHAGFLALVADGMGGMAHGAAASRTAVAAFLEAWRIKGPEETIPDALLRSVWAANRAVCAAASSLGADEEMGSTLVASVVWGERLHWITVGDSLLLLVRDGETTALNTPHVYARELDELAERGAITVWQALGDLSRDSLTSFIGMADLEAVDRTLRGFPLRPGDVLLAASDGVTNALPEPTMVAACENGGDDAQRIASGLVQCVEQRGLSRQDNATVVVMVPGLSNEGGMLPLPPASGEFTLGVVPPAGDAGPGLSPLEVARYQSGGKLREGKRRRLPMLARFAAILLGSLLILLGVVFGPELLKRVPEAPDEEPAPERRIEGVGLPSLPAEPPAEAGAPVLPAPAPKRATPIRGLEDTPGTDIAAPPIVPRPSPAPPVDGQGRPRRPKAQGTSGDGRMEEVP